MNASSVNPGDLKPNVQLIGTFFSNVLVQAHQTRPSEDIAIEFRTEVGLRHDQTRDIWEVTLDVATPGDGSSERGPYTVRLKAHGLFKSPLGPTRTPEEEQRVATDVMRSGATILYSASRELLLGLTARCPWGPWQLPTTTFAHLAPVAGPSTGAEAADAGSPPDPAQARP